MDIKQKILELRKELNLYNYNYYVLDKSQISDYEFDLKLKELQKLEAENIEFYDPNSPTQRIGGEVTKNFETVNHKNIMFSLDNSYSKDDLLNWEKRIRKIIGIKNIQYTCELKFDGVSVNLVYEKRQLIRALTRGDGFKGDDVSLNIRTIKSIPLYIDFGFLEDFEIRGEVIIPLEGFKKMNQKRIENGDNQYSNPRNTASGSIKLQNSKDVAKRPLDCLLYQVVTNDNKFKTHFEILKKAREIGFKIPNTISLANSMNEVFNFVDYWNLNRANLPYETDGVVIKVNNLNHQKKLGYTAKYPRWAIAYKFKAQRVSTKLNKITYQVGRTGAITPVANLKPIFLAGTIVKRASLHNADQIKKLDVRINDVVYIEKGGEIIPKIVGVDTLQRKINSKPIVYISNCPVCNTKLVRKKGDAKHYCINEYGCSPQITGKIQHFISRKAMNIDGIGSETVELLFKEKLIKNYADLYDLTEVQILPLERMAEKSAKKMIKGIEQSKKTPFEKVLFALGIRFVGETVAKKLSKHYESIDNLMLADFDSLVSVDEIGNKIANSVIDYFNEEANKNLIIRLKENGLNLKISKDIKSVKSKKLLGEIIVITGLFKKISRDELKKIIEDNGGKVSSSITKKTTFIVAGEKMGPSKLKKAQKLNILILSEEDFFNKI